MSGDLRHPPFTRQTACEDVIHGTSALPGIDYEGSVILHLSRNVISTEIIIYWFVTTGHAKTIVEGVQWATSTWFLLCSKSADFSTLVIGYPPAGPRRHYTM
jgi:hypothetical protein